MPARGLWEAGIFLQCCGNKSCSSGERCGDAQQSNAHAHLPSPPAVPLARFREDTSRAVPHAGKRERRAGEVCTEAASTGEDGRKRPTPATGGCHTRSGERAAREEDYVHPS